MQHQPRPRLAAPPGSAEMLEVGRFATATGAMAPTNTAPAQPVPAGFTSNNSGPMLQDLAVFNQFGQLFNPQQAFGLPQMQPEAKGALGEDRLTASRGRTRSSDSRNSSAYASRHQAAEQRRRTRINERLELLRKLVPHTERANTASFLEEVIKYIDSLKRRNSELERMVRLSAPQGAAANAAAAAAAAAAPPGEPAPTSPPPGAQSDAAAQLERLREDECKEDATLSGADAVTAGSPHAPAAAGPAAGTRAAGAASSTPRRAPSAPPADGPASSGGGGATIAAAPPAPLAAAGAAPALSNGNSSGQQSGGSVLNLGGVNINLNTLLEQALLQGALSQAAAQAQALQQQLMQAVQQQAQQALAAVGLQPLGPLGLQQQPSAAAALAALTTASHPHPQQQRSGGGGSGQPAKRTLGSTLPPELQKLLQEAAPGAEPSALLQQQAPGSYLHHHLPAQQAAAPGAPLAGNPSATAALMAALNGSLPMVPPLVTGVLGEPSLEEMEAARVAAAAAAAALAASEGRGVGGNGLLGAAAAEGGSASGDPQRASSPGAAAAADAMQQLQRQPQLQNGGSEAVKAEVGEPLSKKPKVA